MALLTAHGLAHDCALLGNNLSLRKKRKYTVQELPQQDFRFLNISMDFLTDFMEGVQDFRVVGYPLATSDQCDTLKS